MNKLKEDSKLISKGIEDISKKLNELSNIDKYNTIDSLYQYLEEVKTLDEDIKNLLDITRDNVHQQKKLLKENQGVVDEIKNQISSMEKLYDVTIFDEPSEPSHYKDEDDNTSHTSNSEQLNASDDLLNVSDLLNQPLPKLL